MGGIFAQNCLKEVFYVFYLCVCGGYILIYVHGFRGILVQRDLFYVTLAVGCSL